MQRMLAVGWFPQAEWELAVSRWPELAAEMPRDHDAYLLAVQRRVKEINSTMTGVRLVMVALSVAEIDVAAVAEGMDAGSAELRGRVATTAALRGVGCVWPPARNDRCWCGSAAKYK